jgi:hypothetical protein
LAEIQASVVPFHVDAEERFEGVGLGDDIFFLELAAQFFYELWGGSCNGKIVYVGAKENLTRGCDLVEETVVEWGVGVAL